MAFNQQEYINNYLKENYYTIKLRMYKEKKDVVKAVSTKTGKSINQLFIEAFEDKYKVDLSIPTNKLMGDNK